MHVYIYICICMYACIHACIHIYILNMSSLKILSTREHTQSTCCTGTNVQILTPHAALQMAVRALVPVCLLVLECKY